MENPGQLSAVVRRELVKKLDPHDIRFYAHLALLFKSLHHDLDADVVDALLCRFVDVLVQLRLHLLVPFYLQHCTGRVGYEKLLLVLADVSNECERKEALVQAAASGFNARQLCTDLYKRVKSSVRLDRAKDMVSSGPKLGKRGGGSIIICFLLTVCYENLSTVKKPSKYCPKYLLLAK